MKSQLTDAAIFLLIIAASVLMLDYLSIFLKEDNSNKNMRGIVYLVSTSGRVQISDFKGVPYVENGYNTWYDKKGSKHWTKAPLMFKKDN